MQGPCTMRCLGTEIASATTRTRRGQPVMKHQVGCCRLCWLALLLSMDALVAFKPASGAAVYGSAAAFVACKQLEGLYAVTRVSNLR